MKRRCITKLNNNNSEKRYIDDCFIIWNWSDTNLAVLLDIVNNLDPNINFTLEEEYSLNSLDVLISKCGEKKTTDMHYKPTNTTQYLHFSSCHSSHTKHAIPNNLARRVCTIYVTTKKEMNGNIN